MWTEMLTLLLLLAIALELAWLIFKGVNSSSQAQQNVSAAIDALTKAQAHWIEVLQNLAEKSAVIKTRESSQTSDKTELGQSEIYLAELLKALEALSDSSSKLQVSAAF